MRSSNNQNNNNNNGGNNNNNCGSTSGRSNQGGRDNYSVRGANRNCNRNNNNNVSKKRVCESLDNNIFDCTSRKNIEVCTKTLKQIIIHVGTEFDSYTEQIKYVV